jgi:hypothetical protein
MSSPTTEIVVSTVFKRPGRSYSLTLPVSEFPHALHVFGFDLIAALDQADPAVIQALNNAWRLYMSEAGLPADRTAWLATYAGCNTEEDEALNWWDSLSRNQQKAYAAASGLPDSYLPYYVGSDSYNRGILKEIYTANGLLS